MGAEPATPQHIWAGLGFIVGGLFVALGEFLGSRIVMGIGCALAVGCMFWLLSPFRAARLNRTRKR